MPKIDSIPTGAPAWIDLFTTDPGKAEEFYGALFGWTAEHGGEECGGYITFTKNGRPVAGGMGNDGSAGAPDAWSVYLATADAEATAAAVEAHGGQVIVPPMRVTDLGSMAVFYDIGKAGIGTWQPGKHKGFGLLAEPGAPAWFELHTRDYKGAVRFYTDVFGWDTHVASDSDDFRYTTFGQGESRRAGIMDVSGLSVEDFPVRWGVYFAVESVDGALAAVTDRGGSVLHGPDDSPFGRLATVADPTGAVFRVQEVPA